MAQGNNPFSGYNGNGSDGTVKDVNSSMWEPISAGAPIRKDTPVGKNGTQAKKTAPAGTKSSPAQKKTQGGRNSGTDFMNDRISQGGPKKQRPSGERAQKSGGKQQRPDDEKKKKPSGTEPPKKKKKPAPDNKRPVGGKSREPKGKDTRNPGRREEKPVNQRDQKRDRSHSKSKKTKEKNNRLGISNDEMRKKRSQSIKLKAKIIGIAAAVLCFVTLVCCAGIYAYRNGATVANIVIEGESRYKEDKIIEAANVYVGINMLSVREKDTNDAVTVALPYIKDVQVDYRFPETLALIVTPTEERMLIEGSSGYICLDKDAKVLSLKKKKLTDGRYLVQGISQQAAEVGTAFVPTEENKAKYERAAEIISLLEATGKFTKGTVVVSDLKDVRVIYDSRINIYLGDCANLESKISDAMDVIDVDEDIKNGQTGYIETRYEGQAPFKPGSMEK
ncbi:MAG: FtsQ-type POTRA domain-containing protein [Clostridia bacterium]|nr:FtsQ-type POTRA domain-containing protein [Clostridia bacterium]